MAAKIDHGVAIVSLKLWQNIKRAVQREMSAKLNYFKVSVTI